MEHDDKVKRYADAFRAGSKPELPIDGINVRFCRAPKGEPISLVTKTDHVRGRRIAFLVKSDTAHQMIGVSGFQIAMMCGWDPGYTASLVNEQTHFAVVVFHSRAAILATWDNLIACVVDTYVEHPEIASKFASQSHKLRQHTPHSLRNIERHQGWTFAEVDSIGEKDPRFMTLDRYARAENTLENALAFSYFVLHCKEQYGGRGMALDSNLNETVQEWIMPSVPLHSLGEHEVLPVTVQIPN